MKYARLSLLFLLFSLSGQAASQDAETLVAGCNECHGQLGVSIRNDVPTIAGQPSAYISAALRAYQQWARPCIKTSYSKSDSSRPATDMCKISEELAHDEIDALGKYYGAQTFIAAKQPFDMQMAEVGSDLHEIHCETCHAMGGSIAARGPILAGQWAPYLRTAIAQALSGEHMVPPVMEDRLIEFSAPDIEALVNFYASQQQP
jgi:sulfide dehydrogenase cytochrome subunit